MYISLASNIKLKTCIYLFFYMHVDEHNLERIIFCSITTTRTESRTVSSVGAGGTDDLRESMQKIMDTFMTEERKDH